MLQMKYIHLKKVLFYPYADHNTIPLVAKYIFPPSSHAIDVYSVLVFIKSSNTGTLRLYTLWIAQPHLIKS